MKGLLLGRGVYPSLLGEAHRRRVKVKVKVKVKRITGR